MAFPFDMSSLQQALNDPAIKQMAQQIANDPSFMEVAKQMQSSFQGLMVPNANPAEMGAQFDPSKYMDVMKNMFENPELLGMAEKLGKTLIESDPHMAKMVQAVQDPEHKAKMEAAMNNLKDDPELKPIFEEMEKQGPMAMMKYWNDPAVLSKLGSAMGNIMPYGLDGTDEEGEGKGDEAEEEEEEVTVHSAASSGNAEQLKKLLEDGADANEKDEEGRTALHFACGYGEMDCANILLEHKANIDAVDTNSNTALHYAAGYGQPEIVKMLVEKGADKSVKNLDGKTALEVAEMNEQADVAAALK